MTRKAKAPVVQTPAITLEEASLKVRNARIEAMKKQLEATQSKATDTGLVTSDTNESVTVGERIGWLGAKIKHGVGCIGKKVLGTKDSVSEFAENVSTSYRYYDSR